MLGLAIPLTTLALITIMAVQAYNEMADFDFGGSIEFVSTSGGIETGAFPKTALLDR